MMARVHDFWFAVGLLVFPLLTVLVARLAGVALGWQPVIALARATLQLAVIAALLRGILTVPWTVVLFIVLMLSTASWTSGGRISMLPGGRRYATTGVLSGALISLSLVFALHLVGTDVRYVIAVAGIVIGNAMSAATLSGRHFHQAAGLRRDEVEGWLSLGATPSQAYADIGRTAVRESVLPNIDQTRSTGLVTLPGAFVGALFGGAGPVDAAKFQLVVLASILLAMTVCGIVVTRLAGRMPHVVVDVKGR